MLIDFASRSLKPVKHRGSQSKTDSRFQMYHNLDVDSLPSAIIKWVKVYLRCTGCITSIWDKIIEKSPAFLVPIMPSQGGSRYEFTNDILNFHDFTNDGGRMSFTIS